MYCSSCGIALSRQMKYCNHCGAQLIRAEDTSVTEQKQQRLDEYLDGLFWITVFGLGFILGGLSLMSKVLHLGQRLIIAYLVLSSTVFLINFGLSLWQVYLMTRRSKETDSTSQAEVVDTNKLGPAKSPTPLQPSSSVTEDPTRAFEPVVEERIRTKRE